MLKKKLQMPRIKLARALPLVGALAKGEGGGKTFGAAGTVRGMVSVPHTLQKRLASSMLDPHFAQNFMAYLSGFGDVDSFLIDLSAVENKRFVCNCQMGAGKGQ